GLTFKENCPDLRNTRVVDILRELADYNVAVDVFDPQVNKDEAEYGIRAWGKPEHVLYDLKYVLDKNGVDLRL
ncbi:UDP binding domain-containing protein, partial [uncultured Halomonas sp.]|uniref:UDP binding domain-containing protein n=1 Tax=uncultured Halomonas sp. TaxID=173971 RepID=UPI00262FD0BF